MVCWIDWVKKFARYSYVILWTAFLPVTLLAQAEILEPNKIHRIAGPPVTLPYLDIQHDRVKHIVIITYDVVFENKAGEEKYKLWIHRIQDKILTSVYQYLTVWWRGDGQVNLDHIRKIIHKVTVAFLGPNLLQKVVIQRLQVEHL